MDSFDFISRIREAGFTIGLMDGNLAISPASSLTDARRAWIKAHKDELVAALRSSESILDAEGGNDLAPANDRALIHVPDYETASGNRYAFDMTVPKANLPALRQSLKFELKDGQGGGSILGQPGASVDEVRSVLLMKYEGRLATIDGESP